MAGDWIKIETCLPDKPEVMRLSHILNIDEMQVVGHLVKFWSWCDQNMSLDCPVVSGTKRGLDRVAMRDGFVDAMVTVGWLEVAEDGAIQIPNYENHLSKSAKQRAQDNKKKQKQREKAKTPAFSMSPNCPDTSGTSSGQNGGPEKRREEKSNRKNSKENFEVTKPEDVSEKVWSDWLAHRKAKRSVVTDLVVAQHRKAAKEKGWNLEDALVECMARGWTGLKAEWLDMKRSPVVDMTNDDWMTRIPS